MTSFSERLRVRMTHLRSLVTRPLTLGIRGVVVDEKERISLCDKAMCRAGISLEEGSRSARPSRRR
jgi:hypothetical protein